MIPNSILNQLTPLVWLLSLIAFMLILFLPTLWELKRPKDAGPRIIPGISIDMVNFFLKNMLRNMSNIEDERLSMDWNLSLHECLKKLVDLELYS